MIDTRDGTARFFDFLSDSIPPDGSLLERSGDRDKLYHGWGGPSGLEIRVARAWTRPIADLRCGECRMLMGQRLGLRWLAAPIARFVHRYPGAECDLYPHDLAINALIGWRDLHAVAPVESRAMMTADFAGLWRELAERPADSLVAAAHDGWSDGMFEAARARTRARLSASHGDPRQP